MSYFSKKAIFQVNSNNRTSGTHSNFTYSIPLDPNVEYDRVAMLSCSIPKSYYIVRSGATFTLTENGNDITITVPMGNYTRQSLALSIKSLLNTNSPLTYTYNVTYPNINTAVDKGLFTFSVSGNGGIQPILNFNNKIAGIVGFDSDTNYQFSSDALTTIYVCNLTAETTLMVRSDICQSYDQSNVLQEIYGNGDASYSYINFMNPTPAEHSKNIAFSGSNIYSFQLTDENGEEINTNGININFTLLIYKKNDIDNLITGYIKYKTLIS